MSANRVVRRLQHALAVPAALVLLAGCLDSGPTTADGTPQLYSPSFGGAGGAATTSLSGVRVPPSLTCRFVRSSGRVECDPVTTNGVTFRASFQFLDANGNAQPQRDNGTNVVNERTEMRGVPTDFGTDLPLPVLFDSVSSTSDVTRRGLLEPFYVISGTHVARTTIRLIANRDTSTQRTTGTSEWRDVRYPRAVVQFRPSPAAFTPGMNLDSALVVSRLTGPWAVSGVRRDETTLTVTARTGSSASTATTAVTYLSADAARVDRRDQTNATTRTSVCLVDRLSFSAICQ